MKKMLIAMLVLLIAAIAAAGSAGAVSFELHDPAEQIDGIEFRMTLENEPFSLRKYEITEPEETAEFVLSYIEGLMQNEKLIYHGFSVDENRWNNHTFLIDDGAMKSSAFKSGMDLEFLTADAWITLKYKKEYAVVCVVHSDTVSFVKPEPEASPAPTEEIDLAADISGKDIVRIQCGACSGSGEIAICCPGCKGTGMNSCLTCMAEGTRACIDCSGSGKTTCTRCAGNLVMQSGQPCTKCTDGKIACGACSGTGVELCPRCGGAGQVNCKLCLNGQYMIDCQVCEGSGWN